VRRGRRGRRNYTGGWERRATAWDMLAEGRGGRRREEKGGAAEKRGGCTAGEEGGWPRVLGWGRRLIYGDGGGLEVGRRRVMVGQSFFAESPPSWLLAKRQF
jgi:hypothetical protein